MSPTRAHVMVTGRVQGVFFRASTRDMAQGLGLRGWVRNLPDGGVEAVFEGEREQVEAAVAWCRTGPPAARVGHCDVIWEEARGAGPFTIHHER